MTPRQLALRAGCLGLVSGGRSTAGVTAVVASSGSPDATAGRPLSLLAGQRAERVAGLVLLGELVADKLPSTPSRLMPPALVLRAATGTVSAWALAQRHRAPAGVPAALGGLGALAGSVAGMRWRRAAVSRGLPDLPAALLEDVLVLVLARAATRPPAAGSR